MAVSATETKQTLVNQGNMMRFTLGEAMGNPQFGADAQSVYTLEDYKRMLYTAPIETTSYKLQTDEVYRKKFAKDQILGKAFPESYDISQDTDAALREYDSMIMGPLRPEAIGRMIVANKPIMKPTGQIRYFNQRGRTGDTSRGRTDYLSSADRSKILEYKANDEIVTSDKYDLNFKEDNEPMAISEAVNSLGIEHSIEVSQRCINEVTHAGRHGSGSDWTDASGNTHPRGQEVDVTDPASLDSIIDISTKSAEAYWFADAILMNPLTLGTLSKTEDFQRSDYFQASADWNNGMIRSMLGMTIYVSPQVPSPATIQMWGYKKEDYQVLLVRRDNLVTSFSDPENSKEGVSWSSRIGFFCKYGECSVHVK